MKCILTTNDQLLFKSCHAGFRDADVELFFAPGKKDCFKILKNENIDAAILDSSRTNLADGFATTEEAVERLHAAIHPGVLIVLVEAGRSPEQTLELLRLGVDDVVTKPIRPRLLAEQIKAFSRLASAKTKKTRKTLVSTNGAISLNVASRRCYIRGDVPGAPTEVKLTRNEFAVLSLLLGREGILVTYDDFRKRLWPAAISTKEFHHTLLQTITNIRKKLAQSPLKIQNLWGEGYRIE